jgi:hypothetical protein
MKGKAFQGRFVSMLAIRTPIYQGQLQSLPQKVVPIFVAPHAPMPVQSLPQHEGMSFGTFLAGLATLVGGVVLLDPKASKEAKAVAQMALSASVPFLLNRAFDLQTWPGQQWN